MSGVHADTGLLGSFPVIFFGSLIIAGIIALYFHRRLDGLPKIGERFYDPIVLILGLWCLGGLLIDACPHCW